MTCPARILSASAWRLAAACPVLAGTHAPGSPAPSTPTSSRAVVSPTSWRVSGRSRSHPCRPSPHWGGLYLRGSPGGCPRPSKRCAGPPPSWPTAWPAWLAAALPAARAAELASRAACWQDSRLRCNLFPPCSRTPRWRARARAHVASRTRHCALRTRDCALPSQTPACLRAPRFGSLPMPTPFRTEPLTPRNLPLHAPACTQAREAVAAFCAHTILPPDVCCIHPTRARARPACCLPRSLVGPCAPRPVF